MYKRLLISLCLTETGALIKTLTKDNSDNLVYTCFRLVSLTELFFSLYNKNVNLKNFTIVRLKRSLAN